MRPLDLLLNPRGFVVAVLLLCLLSQAQAAYVLIGPQGYQDTGGSFPPNTAASLCQSRSTLLGSGLTGTPENFLIESNGQRSASCRITGGPYGSTGMLQEGVLLGWCAGGNQWYPGGGGNCWSVAPSCPEGQEADPSGFCAAPVGCASTAGTSKEVNFTVGYTRTANDDDYALVAGRSAVPAAGSSMCDGSCQVTVGAPVRAWHSLNPSVNGLYRTSVDVAVTTTATSCTTATPEIDPLTEPAPCDGTVGYINGKRTCVKSSPSPDTVVPAPAAEYNGNPRAGTEPNPTTPSNPAGREPTGGTGGPDGGPPSGSAGGLPRGTGAGPGTGGAGGAQTIKVEIPDLKDPCGIPGSPPCKIDETGTPDGEGALGEAGDGVDDAKDQIIDLIDGIKEHPGPPPWTWTFALPTGCSPIPVGGFAPFLDPIDICEFQPMFHDLMSVVWLLGTVGGCVTLLYRTLIGGD